MAYEKEYYTIERLANELDRDRRTIANALVSYPGDAIVKHNRVFFLTTALQALGAWKRGDENLDDKYERARKDKELADRLSMQNATTRGELVDGRVVDQVVITLFTELKTRLLGVGRQIAEYAIHAKDVGELEELITDGIRDALDILSTFDPRSLRPRLIEGNEVDSDTEDASEVDNQRVGRSRATPQPRGQRRTRTVEDE